jgi:hypothetical protein
MQLLLIISFSEEYKEHIRLNTAEFLFLPYHCPCATGFLA